MAWLWMAAAVRPPWRLHGDAGHGPQDGQCFLLHMEVPGPAKLMGCPCHRGAEDGGFLLTLKVLHHELLPEMILLLVLLQASKLQCWWIMAAGELC